MSATTDEARPTTRAGSVPRSGASRLPSVPAPARPEREEAPPAAPAAARAEARELRDLFEGSGAVNLKLIYAAYLVGLALPLAAAVGFAFAWLGRRGRPPAWLASHYTYLIRTFWIGLGAYAMAFALSFLGVGLLLYPLIAVWVVARAVHGLSRAARGEEIEHPEGFFV